MFPGCLCCEWEDSSGNHPASMRKLHWTFLTQRLKISCQCKRWRRCEFNPWVRKDSWSKKWQLTSIFLPGKFYGQRSLVGYHPWGHKDSDRTEWRSTHTHTHTHTHTCIFLLKVIEYVMKSWAEPHRASKVQQMMELSLTYWVTTKILFVEVLQEQSVFQIKGLHKCICSHV